MKEYYDRRAPEYDDWWLGRGLYADRARPDWADELVLLEETVAALAPLPTLDVACGTRFLTRHSGSVVVGLDQSWRMLVVARAQAPAASDALALPLPDSSFARLFSSSFYCHLEEPERGRFLAEARRLAPELVLVGSRLLPGEWASRHEERVLADGSRGRTFKRFVVVGSP